MPTFSTILLLPDGPEWSTVEEATRDFYVSAVSATVQDKELLCHWLFNAKTIERHVVVTTTGSEADYTEILRAGNDGLSLLATDFPLPHNYDIGGVITCPAINADANNGRWIKDGGGSHSYYSYVFVFEGDWYWTPGILFSGQTISSLTLTDFTVSWPSGDGTVTITHTITETFY